MATARQIVTLGRQVRTESKVRVRQPLALAVVHVPGDRGRLEPLLDLIAEELNVAGLRFAESAEAISGWRAKPNFRTLGPVLGPRVREVAAALADDDGSLARELAAGSPVAVHLPSGHLELRPEDVELAQEVRSGWGVASDGTVTVALDLELTGDLRRQGLAREVVRAVQDLRKSAGLEVSDRILLAIEADQGTLADLQDLLPWVGGEVLATDVRAGALEGAEGSAELAVDGRTIRLRLRRAGPA
jgi:isoleucyl-tRNA synthetase